ncbi:MAG: hypothetical protein C4B58_08625 [Deltaproteobacteria bacterium]|nr:MAG: hypothetical protein C4B58_08625 [Deltaproteobacteria bacterium]
MPQNNSPIFLPDIKVDLPSPDELEISLFGPGRGECVVAHLGNNDWLVVDSCLDNTSLSIISFLTEFTEGFLLEFSVCSQWLFFRSS